MKVKINISLFLLVFISNLPTIAQNIDVDYLVRINANRRVYTTESRYVLAIQGNLSSFFDPAPGIEQFIYAKNARMVDMGSKQMVSLDENTFTSIQNDQVYKDYANNQLFSKNTMVRRKVVIREPLDGFDWKIDPKSDSTIMGYACQRATATFLITTVSAF
jgi:GLPGLI family protein